MGFFRIYPTKDTFITDAHPERSSAVRATGSNHGRSPALNVFGRKHDIVSGSIELARTLIQFDVTELSGKIYSDGIIPSSSVSYYLKMFDMKHEDTVPVSYDLFAFPLSQSWDEGKGIDNIEFLDDGFASWRDATSATAWDITGSDFLTASYGSGSQRFDDGDEDLELNITDVVVNWLTGSIVNNGLVVKLGDTEEASGENYYRKAFHGFESKFVDKLPYIEARWDNVIKDNRNNFALDNNSNLYIYNFVRGELTALSEPVIVRIQDHVVGVSSSYSGEITASFVETGVYSASFTVESTASFSSSWTDVWFSGSRVYMTGNFSASLLPSSQVDPYDEFTVDITNLKGVYQTDEEARLKVNVRKRDYVTHVGSLVSGSLSMEREYIEKMYYSVVNDETGETVISFGTGSVAFTQLSYDGDGNYFNIWMNSFVPGFLYRLIFLIDINRYDKKIIDEGFKFKVV